MAWQEMVVRLAVAQAHKLHLREHINVGWRAEPLNLEGQPWVGDLLLAPFGGATHGLDPDPGAARGDGQGGAQAWPGFGERLKTVLREAGHNPGPRHPGPGIQCANGRCATECEDRAPMAQRHGDAGAG